MKFKTKIEQLDTDEIVNSEYINWDFYKDSTILVTGATGLIGYQTVLSILRANETLNSNIKILALVRNKEKALKKFSANKSQLLKFVVQDIIKPIKIPENVDYIIHTANSTSSKGFVEEPVETINSIIEGTKNILEF
ncbi:NAD-dependent epimerase/dehydratase family protein, partial [bacterium]|nr:NAD-dependent epimerase/dehydratase family protein [bacterium]